MKKIFICLLFIFMFALAGCDGFELHVHAFSNEWTSDETKHWHVATCEHTDLIKDLGTHEDSDNDGKCDVCEYEISSSAHTHTFSTEWSKNETSHWHVATCEHTDLTSDLSNHTFDEDGKCTICEYQKQIEAPVNTYVVNFINTLTKEVTTLSVDEGDVISPIDDPIVDAYTFNGWADIDDNIIGSKNDSVWASYTVNENINLYSSFTANKVNLVIDCDSFLGEFDINIDDEDYISEFNEQVEVGTVIRLRAKPAEYATMNGWKENDTDLSNELIYTFTVEDRDYDIDLDLVGKEYSLIINGINCEVEANDKYKAGELISLEAATTVPGFTFNGYYDDEDNLLSNKATYSFKMPGNDYVVNAKSYGNTHTITMHLTREGNDQVTIPIRNEVIEKRAGEEFVLIPPQLRGYTCMASPLSVTMPERDLEYTFKYSPITYTITYCNIYGGEYTGDNADSLPKTYTVLDNVSIPNPTILSPYIAAWFYWYYDSDCSGEHTNFLPSGEDSPAKNLVLYANITYWNDDKLMECVARYIDEDGNEIAPQVNIGKLPYNQIITGYDIPDIEGYELKNSCYGSRMGVTSESKVYIDVQYSRKEYDLEYILVFATGQIKPLFFVLPPAPTHGQEDKRPLEKYKYGTNATLYIPEINEPGQRAEGLYFDSTCKLKVTHVDPTWTGKKILYIKLIPEY